MPVKEGKKWWASKTLLAAAIQEAIGITMLVQEGASPSAVTLMVLGAAQVVLRIITKEGLTL
jgi:hypothetical protein